MSELLISLGLQSWKRPDTAKRNVERGDRHLEKVRNVLKGYLLSTSDFAGFMGIERESASHYLAKLKKQGVVEVAGETVHHGKHAKEYVWRLI